MRARRQVGLRAGDYGDRESRCNCYPVWRTPGLTPRDYKGYAFCRRRPAAVLTSLDRLPGRGTYYVSLEGPWYLYRTRGGGPFAGGD